MSLFRSTRGAITIFECIIFMALLILAGVIIDAARISVAERKVQGALNASARSLLANYNTDLVGEYGIFGVDTRSPENMLKDEFIIYLHQNIQQKTKGFAFIKYEVNSDSAKTGVQGMESLLSANNFRNQVLQYMKYRAPLTMTQNVIQKFTSSGISKKVRFAESEKKVRSKWKDLKKCITGINDLVGEAEKTSVKELADLKNVRACLYETLAKSRNVSGLLQEYYSEGDKSDSVAAESDPDEVSVEGSEISISRQQFDNLTGRNDTLKSQIENNLRSLDDKIVQVETLQLQLASCRSERGAILSQIDVLESGFNDEESEDEAQIRNKKLQELKTRLNEVNTRIDNLNQKSAEIMGSFKLDKIGRIPLEENDSSYSSPDNRATERVQSFLDGLMGRWDGYLLNIDPEWLIEKEEFNEAEWRDELARSQLETQSLEQTPGEAEAEERNNNVLQYMQGFLSMLADAAQNGMEKVYIVEYIMDKHTYVTSRTERGHYLEKGEVEYILWGSRNQAENIAKTMGSIWFLRFAIDSVDKFATSTVPEPVSRLIDALVEGFTLSCYDMIELYEGNEISICPSLKKAVKVSYADHLRVFLLLSSATESQEKARLDNLRQLVQINIKQLDDGFALKNYSTVIHARAEVSINLWFLPLLQLDKLKLKNFKDGRYVIVKEAYMGY